MARGDSFCRCTKPCIFVHGASQFSAGARKPRVLCRLGGESPARLHRIACPWACFSDSERCTCDCCDCNCPPAIPSRFWWGRPLLARTDVKVTILRWGRRFRGLHAGPCYMRAALSDLHGAHPTTPATTETIAITTPTIDSPPSRPDATTMPDSSLVSGSAPRDFCMRSYTTLISAPMNAVSDM